MHLFAGLLALLAQRLARVAVVMALVVMMALVRQTSFAIAGGQDAARDGGRQRTQHVAAPCAARTASHGASRRRNGLNWQRWKH